jgi:hypothetical protein
MILNQYGRPICTYMYGGVLGWVGCWVGWGAGSGGVLGRVGCGSTDYYIRII